MRTQVLLPRHAGACADMCVDMCCGVRTGIRVELWQPDGNGAGTAILEVCARTHASTRARACSLARMCALLHKVAAPSLGKKSSVHVNIKSL